ncbi:agroclavine dehydrogenase protein [Rutstroemia sp. NJR-2017a WRK4]|nr:agroclavine dehydrogenase protein [Rutstroemia sp. NJR-2017a WRK4]
MSPTKESTILLLGGTGKVASRIAALLHASSYPTLLAHRSSAPLSSLPDVPACKFDWTDASTYSNPFQQVQNIQAVFLVAPPVMDMLPPMKDFIDLAVEKGVKRFVLLSASLLPAGGPAMGMVHEYLSSLKLDYAVLRPTWFMENFSEQHHRVTIRDTNSITSATGNGKVPFVSADDIAAVGFHALTDETLQERDLVILGPEALSYDDVAEIIGRAVGRKITHVKVSAQELSRQMTSVGIPKDYADMLAGMDDGINKGAEERLNNTVLEVTGKQPKRFTDFVEDAKAVWKKE